MVNYFNINIIPSFNYFYSNISNAIGFIYRTFISLNKIIISHKLEDYKISSIRNIIKNYYKDDNKITMGMPEIESTNKEISTDILNPRKHSILQRNNTSVDYDSNTKNNNTRTRVIRRINRNSNIRGSSSNSNSSNNINNNNAVHDVSINTNNVIINNNNYNHNHINNKDRLYLPDDRLLCPTSSSYNSPIPTIPATPVYSTLPTPNTMSPLFPSSTKSGVSSIRSSYENNTVTCTNYYNSAISTNYNSVTYNNYNFNVNPHPYLVPGDVAYFNPARISSDTNKATLGLNGSNERL
jgi:hypothetical protein